MPSNSRNSCQKEFLITMRAIKSFDTILFVSSSKFPKFLSKGRISYHNNSNQKSWLHTFLSSHVLMKTQCEPKIMLIKTQTLKCLCLHVFQFQKFLSKKAEFLITMRATKSFDTILFVSSCLQISEIPVTIKGRVFFQWEQSKALTFLSSHVLMKTHCEPKIMFMFVSSCLPS